MNQNWFKTSEIFLGILAVGLFLFPTGSQAAEKSEDFSIFGIHLGMTLEQVQGILHTVNSHMTEADRTLKNPLDNNAAATEYIEGTFSDQSVTKIVWVRFSLLDGRVESVVYHVIYSDQSLSPSEGGLSETVIAKYGNPSGYDIQQMIWQFDNSGDKIDVGTPRFRVTKSNPYCADPFSQFGEEGNINQELSRINLSMLQDVLPVCSLAYSIQGISQPPRNNEPVIKFSESLISYKSYDAELGALIPALQKIAAEKAAAETAKLQKNNPQL